MSRIALSIKNRLSLRKPQWESLNILDELCSILNLDKEPDLKEELKKVINKFPTVSDFEREFPSICFSLATGVGKTRLMGAFIAYLYLNKGIKNFFVVAPNLTIYKKLIDDFGNCTNPKYVFKGISEFAVNHPNIVTGDNYENLTKGQIAMSDVTINIFNISKINGDTQKPRGKKEQGKPPKIKRLSEYIGDSYFNYLSTLEDLVIIMDESHHYRADKGMQALNELKPILGLEVTATPQVEKSNKTIKFKNVVYEYSLGKALSDGKYVKIPAVATRKNFNPDLYKNNLEKLDDLKLEDGIRLHEETKVNLELYSRDHDKKYIKPFILVVAKDTDHSAILLEKIKSDKFFNGYYKDKVIEINSNQTGSEKEENIEKLLSLESVDNNIEIVIHVNMLKEGWDVTNLYTIIPLRTAASTTLREQTIGRGLRLPYGERTGNKKVDTLTIVSHDKFQEIVDEANKADSIIKKENIIEIDESEISEKKEVITTETKFEENLREREKQLNNIVSETERQSEKIRIEVDRKVVEEINTIYNTVSNIKEFKIDNIKKIVVERLKDTLETSDQIIFEEFKNEYVREIEERYDSILEEYISNIIEIPRIVIQPTEEVICGFNDFDLDVSKLNYQPIDEEIIRKSLVDGSIESFSNRNGANEIKSLEEILLIELLNNTDIDYERDVELIYKLIIQALNKLKSYLNDYEVRNVVDSRKVEIAKFIYSQMKEHFYLDVPNYEKPKVYPFTKILEHNFTKVQSDSIHDFRETVQTSQIRKLVFAGFKKACHNMYKFDSKTEKDFSIILEDDKNVIKWLRPAANQFNIYWDYNSKEYRPDFVVEDSNFIYLVETKKEKEIDDKDVKAKAKAALEYCLNATAFNIQNEGKPWKYVLIPHSVVKLNMSLDFLVNTYGIEKLEDLK
ncbi:DEAD/DEAH box helicase [Clostridium sp.]|uniref:DEAD/DEAH box helicase n=1 Tax=Clostridium TaxID=1485 RepID=UPI0028FFE6EE|nr:DEAD/DEAH box helicase family protein [Clostridium sp.]MDU2683611.1 DEAD/DEAH box helicase family protein [Clostridium sp.]